MTVNKILRKLALCTLASLAVTTMVNAQWEQNDKEKLGIGFTTFMPSSGDVKDGVGNAWLGPTVSYNLTFDELDRPTSFVSLGFLAKDGNDGGYDGSLTPLTYTRVKRFGNATSAWYTGAGAGVYLSKLKPHSGNFSSDSSTGFGLHLVGGRDIGKWAFAELRYNLVTNKPSIVVPAPTPTNPFATETKDVNLSGLTLTVGIRGAF